jgi:hypothetical protein
LNKDIFGIPRLDIPYEENINNRWKEVPQSHWLYYSRQPNQKHYGIVPKQPLPEELSLIKGMIKSMPPVLEEPITLPPMIVDSPATIPKPLREHGDDKVSLGSLIPSEWEEEIPQAIQCSPPVPMVIDPFPLEENNNPVLILPLSMETARPVVSNPPKFQQGNFTSNYLLIYCLTSTGRTSWLA